MSTVAIEDRDSSIVAVPLAGSGSLMEALRDAGMSVQGLCGGNGICSTCHILLDDSMYRVLPEPDEDELDTLRDLPDYREGSSRLACQISQNILPPGFRATLAPW